MLLTSSSSFSLTLSPKQKTPVARNPPGLLAAPEGFPCKPSEPVIQKGLLHLLAMIEFNRTLAGLLRSRQMYAAERIACERHDRVPG